uniref:BPTI/Kunitz inhibitor domain-containing protein n=1 Tax=Meloidogyne enterolobii TaxID=390850 RepID=A0A6V7UTJ8_MELEN|nr:unnamed protein product [Meloidogyne enterolobii]
MCLSFVYKGCGENKNGFNSKDDANGVFQINFRMIIHIIRIIQST